MKITWCSKLLTRIFYNLPYTSIGIRLHSWNETLKWIKQKPMLGWGENAKKEIMSKSNFPQWVKDRYRHLHNFYLRQTTSSHGFIGLWISLYIYYFLLKSVNYLSKENKILLTSFGLHMCFLSFYLSPISLKNLTIQCGQESWSQT